MNASARSLLRAAGRALRGRRSHGAPGNAAVAARAAGHRLPASAGAGTRPRSELGKVISYSYHADDSPNGVPEHSSPDTGGNAADNAARPG